MQSLTLGDGRTLTWQEVGASRGRPVFFFHGGNDSRLASGLLTDAARAAGVRIISPDRPGFGGSDFHPHRSFVSWSRDVGELADHLGLDTFGAIGHSGGGPHALAVAAGLGSRVEGVVGVASAAPRAARAEGMAWPFRLNRFLASCLPGLLPVLVRSHRSSLGEPQTYLRRWGSASPADGELFRTRPDVGELVVAEQREAYRNGIAGPLLENELYYRDWGFELSAVKQPVHLVYGSEDTMAPLSFGRYLTDALPHAELHVVSGEGHVSIVVNEAKRILALADDRRREGDPPG